jgi:hypothetical protein
VQLVDHFDLVLPHSRLECRGLVDLLLLKHNDLHLKHKGTRKNEDDRVRLGLVEVEVLYPYLQIVLYRGLVHNVVKNSVKKKRKKRKNRAAAHVGTRAVVGELGRPKEITIGGDFLKYSVSNSPRKIQSTNGIPDQRPI